jgi:hypothetical protein
MTDQTVTAWRAWVLDRQGRLYSLQDRSPRGMWTRFGQRKATCDMPPNFYTGPATRQAAVASTAAHAPPGENCTCGWRGIADLEAMLSAVVESPHTLGLTADTWRVAGVYDARVRMGALDIPDVIGEVELSGPVSAGHPGCDPPATLRAANARVGYRLHLARHYAHLGKALRRWYPKADVRIAEQGGLTWLDEIWSAEGGQFDDGDHAA